MAITREMVQELYVAYFSRPADVGGLEHWYRAVNSEQATLEQVAAAFAASEEYTSTFEGMNNLQIINTIYLNLFGRDAEPEGLLFWGNALDTGAMTVSDAVLYISGSALGEDATIFANKVTAATAFTDELDTTPEILGYSGAAANAAAREWLAGITGDESLAAAIDPDALALTVELITDIGNADAGDKFVLTSGIDTLTGGAGNDTFTAVWNGTGDPATTLTPLDSINGSTGRDTLNIDSLVDLTGLPSVTVSNIEVVHLRGAGAVTADTTAWAGVERLALSEAHGAVSLTAAAATDIVATVKTDATKLGGIAIEGGNDVTVRASDLQDATQTITVGAGGNTPTGVVTVDAVGKAAVSGGTLAMGDIFVNGGSTINVKQMAAANTVAMTGKAASHTQGDIVINGSAVTTTVNVKQTAAQAGVDAIPAVAEVRETATVTFVPLEAGQSFSIAGLTFEASRALTAEEVAQAFANLVNGTVPTAGDTQGSGAVGNGAYTGAITGWTSSAADGATVVFTSVEAGDVGNLTVTGGGVPDLAPVVVEGVDEAGEAAQAEIVAGTVLVNDENGTIKTVTVDGYGAGSGLSGSKAAYEQVNLAHSNLDFTVLKSAPTLGMQLEAVGASDLERAAVTLTTAPATLNVRSVGNNYVTLVAAATEVLNVSGTGTLDVGAGGLGGLKSVTVSEAAGLDASQTKLGAGSVDATGTTGDVSVLIDASVTTYAGGAGADWVTLTAPAGTLNKSISLGAGDDVLDASALSAAELGGTTVTHDGGEGTDTIALSAAAAATLSAGVAFEGKISGFERLWVGELGADTEVNLDNVDDISFVIANGASGAYTLTLNNMLGNGTVALAAASDVVVAMADATGTADVLNVIATDASSSTVTANGVETINVNGTASHTLTLEADAATTINVGGYGADDEELPAGTQQIVLGASTKSVSVINGSGATSNLVIASSAAPDAVAVTITGGAGDDVLTVAGDKADVLNGGAGNDILVAGSGLATLTGGAGYDLFVINEPSANVNSYATITDFSADDLIQFTGAAAFVSTQIVLGDTAVFQDYANAAINALGLNEVGWFTFGGNTYLVSDLGAANGEAGFVNGEDLIVRLTGEIDLTQASFNVGSGTIGLV